MRLPGLGPCWIGEDPDNGTCESVLDVVSIERAPIRFDVQGGSGILTIGEISHAELEPYKGPDRSTTTLTNTIFSTVVPGALASVGKATRYRSKHEALGHDLDLSGHNALQSTFVFDG